MATQLHIPKLEPRKRRPQPANPTPVPETPPLPAPSHPLFPSPSPSPSQPSSSETSPSQPTLSTTSSPHTFQVPKRRILTPNDHSLFLASPTKDLLLAWIFHLSASVASTPRSAVLNRPSSPAIHTILAILADAQALVAQNPPENAAGSRFGNKAFRNFLDAITLHSSRWHAALLNQKPLEAAAEVQAADKKPHYETSPSSSSSPSAAATTTTTTNITTTTGSPSIDPVNPTASAAEPAANPVLDAAAAEISTYLLNSFGDRSRIDYGSGHELNFLVWLLALYSINLFPLPSDLSHIVLSVFPGYLALMRSLQTTYYLEPAGSHGVWGLDDYQFLPFLFGASQLLNHPYITPRSIHQPLTIEESAHEYLYLDQIAFVNSTKTVRGLRWHSPMLDDISSAKSWNKIDAGMRRMFLAEVLGKLPVMQHFLFGSLVPAADGMTEEDAILDETEHAHAHAHGDGHGDGEGHAVSADPHTGHAHDGKGWGDCCGIKVPSSIAAAQEAKKGSQGQTLRRIPFD